MTVSAGSRLGPYEVLSPLGAGGMGEVWRGRDSRLDREVAIKVLPAEVSADTSRLKRFEKEARAASSLNHPNIVTIYDLGVTGGVSWIAMERVEGKTLRDLLVASPLPIKRVLSLSAQIADGLSKAHEAGIVHRDLKPENVMVTKDGLVKILDFGLAKLGTAGSGSGEGSHLPTETGTSPGMVLGTVGYMSPEQASGEAVDFRSDQFALGSILYEMATGRRAFAKKTAVDTLSAILNEEPEPIAAVNPQAPAPLRWVVERCLAKDPGERYASTEDLARDLATLRDRLSETGASGAVPQAAPSRRSRLRTAVLPLAFAVALAVGIFAGRPLWKAQFSSHPTLRQVTFRRAGINDARFGPDGQTIIYSVQNEGAGELFTARPGTPESRALGMPPANIDSVSASGELAIKLGQARFGTLATVSLAGGAPRELLENTCGSSWAPDGKSLAVMHQVDGRMRIEYPIGKLLYQLPSPTFFLEFSPSGQRILFHQNGDLITLDLSGKTRKIASVPFEAHWSPRGDEIWFNEIEGGTTSIRAVSLSGNRRFLASFTGEFAFHDVSREGRVLLERIAEEHEIVGSVGGAAAERNLSWLDGSVPVDLSADGTLLLFTETGMGGGPGRAVYKRKTDGSPAVRLGEGRALALSPDGQWALSAPRDLVSPPGELASHLVLLPMGAGQPRELPLAGFRLLQDGACFFPDGKRILLRGIDAEQKIRLYVLDIETGKARAVTPERVSPTEPFLISPDGNSILCKRKREYELYDLVGGGVKKAPPLGGVPIRWCEDGRSLFVMSGEKAKQVDRVELATGRREPWKEFSISDLGSGGVWPVLPTPDGKSFVYGYLRSFADLFVAEGLK